MKRRIAEIDRELRELAEARTRNGACHNQSVREQLYAYAEIDRETSRLIAECIALQACV